MALSEESRVRRGRTHQVNIQMTFISWSLEFLTGTIALAFILLKIIDDDTILKYVILSLDMSLNSIIIPGSYLLNNEVNRSLIATRGWYKTIRNTLCPAWRKERGPVEQDPPINGNASPPKIPTISGNINSAD